MEVCLCPPAIILLLQRIRHFISHWFILSGAVKDNFPVYSLLGSLQDAHTHASPRGIPPPGCCTPLWGSPSWTTRLWEDATCTCNCWGEVFWRSFDSVTFCLFLFYFSVVSLTQTWQDCSLHFFFYLSCYFWDAIFFNYLYGKILEL